MNSSYFLTSPRLGFRSWSSDDIDLAVGLWGDPLVTEMIDARDRLSREDVEEKLRTEIERELEFGVQYWPVFFLDTGEHAGCCGLRPHEPEANLFELGFHIRSKFWRKGLAEEAARAVIEHAFGRLGVAGLFAGHHPDNAVSRKLLLKLGFQPSGAAFYPPTGLEHPGYLLSRDAWELR